MVEVEVKRRKGWNRKKENNSGMQGRRKIHGKEGRNERKLANEQRTDRTRPYQTRKKAAQQKKTKTEE